MEAGSGPSKLVDPTLLEAIDKLFELNIGEYVALPQLLVVGDQSSGKSSVLEGLTGLPCPRDNKLCTRFATQITFRRAPTTKFTVSVIPAINAQPDYAERVRKWRKDDLKSFDSQTFADILREVYQLMGLGESESAYGDVKKTFADDVLKIEICGPEQQHLSVIDVPGIFRKKTLGVTTQADMDMVRNMVLSYMQNPRSAMLAVIPANVDIGTQEILDMAEKCDPKGERTLGVLTKPDLVDEGGEQAIVDIVEGKSHSLNLGWFVVRNSGQQQLKDSSEERHAREKLFFSTVTPWKHLAHDRVGVAALQTRLVDILTELIRREFPNVRSDINKRLKGCRQQLEALGPHRETKDQQYKYLLELATRFQTVTSLALKAHYGGDDILGDSTGLRLATAIVRRNTIFADDVWRRGHTKDFVTGERPEEEEGENQEEEEEQEVEPKVEYSVRYQRNHPDLDDILLEDRAIAPPEAGDSITAWLEDIYKNSQGFELGTFDPALLPIVWKEQSAKRDALAMGYINDVVCLVHSFTIELLSKICKDERIRRGLSSALLDILTERYKRSIDHTRFLLMVERSGTPLTTNHYFGDNLEKCRQQRYKAKIETHNSASGSKYVKLDALMQITNKASNLEQTVDDLHDILKSYYKVARKRFVDVLCMQAADFHLITGPDTPIKVFSPAFVSELTTSQLETIAGEDVVTKRKRAELKREIESLENGRKLL